MVTHREPMLSIHQGHEFILALERVGLNTSLARQVVDNAGLAQDLVEALRRWAREGLGDKFFSKKKESNCLKQEEQYPFLEALAKAGLNSHLAQFIIQNSKVAEAVVQFLETWWSDYRVSPNAHWEGLVKRVMEHDVPAMVRDPHHDTKVYDHKETHWHICHCHTGDGVEVLVLSLPLKADGSILTLKEETDGIQPAKWQHRALPLKPGTEFVEFETLVEVQKPAAG